ncbi:MAG: hypothetical protein IT440_05450 [Phycisphaeraceae bacterium]|nr:hypothetical protein [Phycisphaeraceae bacterium]
MTRNQIIFAFVLVLIVVGLASCAGFDLGDVVKVRTPNRVQQTAGLPSSTSLNEAVVEYQAWFEDVQRTGAQWKSNIDRANEVRGMLSQITLSALDEVGPTLAGIPLLGPMLPAATGLLGLFLGVGSLRKEKEDSFNKGLEEGRKTTTSAGA